MKQIGIHCSGKSILVRCSTKQHEVVKQLAASYENSACRHHPWPHTGFDFMTDIGSILIFIAFQSRCTIYRAHLDRSRSSVAESNSCYWSEAGTGRGEEFARYSLLHKNPLLSKSKHFNFNLYINILFFVSTLILFRICRHDPVWRQIASTVKNKYIDGYSLCPLDTIDTGTDVSNRPANELSHQESCLFPNALQVCIGCCW